MLPQKFYKHLETKIKINLLTTGTLFDWDNDTKHLKPAKGYFVFQMWAGVVGGFWFVGIHMLQMYLKTNQTNLPEEGNPSEEQKDLRTFATLMIEAGEILFLLSITLIGLVFCWRYKLFMYLFNQLMDYNKKLSEMIESGKLVLTAEQEKVIKLVNFLNYLVMFISSTLPFGIVAAFQAKIEPTNQLFEEWLEFPLEFSWQLSPVILIMIVAAFGVGTTLSMMMTVIAVYFMTSLICTEALMPDEFQWTPKIGKGRCKIQTAGFGELTDLEVVHLYRIQQILNTYLNAFFRSVFIAFHHVGCLAIVVTLLVFAVRYEQVIREDGPIGYIVVLSCIYSPLALIYFQSKMAGAVVDISEDFKFEPCKKMMRKLLFRKFARSCTTFYIEVAYPFYTVNKETFSGFMQQAQDYSMTLLLW